MSPPRKSPNLWILVGVTYGAVILVTILALVGSHYLASRGKLEPQEKAGNIAVGTVWVTMYPGAIVHNTASARHNDFTEGTMKFGTGDSPSKVLGYYRTALHKSGFQLEATVDSRTVRAIGRAGKVEVTVSADPNGDGSEAEIATLDRQKK